MSAPRNTGYVMSKARPILFNGAMVRALLEGRKTNTRRVVKPQPDVSDNGCWDWHFVRGGFRGAASTHLESFPKMARPYCPFGRVGDLMYVRETFVQGSEYEDGQPKEAEDGGYVEKIWYRASDPSFCWDHDGEKDHDNPPWKPSIHMPKWASRLTLEITGVRVERLQDISEEDAKAEGIGEGEQDECLHTNPTAYNAFKQLWDGINGYGTPSSWDANSWVWVIEFKVHNKNVESLINELER